MGDLRQESGVKSSLGQRNRSIFPLVGVLALLGSLLTSGCYFGPSQNEEKPSSQTERVETPTEVTSEEPAGGGDRQTSTNRQPDYRKDRWQSEAWSQAVAAQLKQIGEGLADAEKLSAEILTPVAAADFVCGPLRPPNLAEVYTGQRMTVLRVDPKAARAEGASPARYAGPAGLARALRAMMQFPDSLVDVRLHLRIVSAETKEKSFTSEVHIETSGRSKQGIIQQNATWECHWAFGEEAQSPKLQSIKVLNYEQVVYRGSGKALFEDCTRAALSANQSFQEQLSLGMNSWAKQTEGEPSRNVEQRCGIAVGDVNGDGLEDVYVCQRAGMPNRLLVQNADGTATDVSAAAGVDWLDSTASALLVDLDNDGDQDLAVATAAGVILMENDSTGQFQRKNVLPLGDGISQSLVAVDYDRDGRLDLYLTMAGSVKSDKDHEEDNNGGFRFHDVRDAGGNVLLRNEIFGDGPWRFTNVTRSAGLYQNHQRYSLAAAWEDFDNDGDLDLYVANDYGKNSLYRNDGGYFRDLAKLAKTAEYGSGKSVSWADYDRDGYMDLYVGNTFSPAGLRITSQAQFMPETDDTTRAIYRRFAQGNTLYRNLGNGTFAEVGNAMGVQAALWAWSSRFVDWNNDGWEDLLVANGYLSGKKEPVAEPDLASFYWQEVVSQAKVPLGTADAQHGSPTDVTLTEMIRRGRTLAGQQRNRVYLNTGGERFADVSAVSGFDFADDGRAMALVDWDGDGDIDVWTLNHSAPQLRLMCNTSETDNHSLTLRLEGRTCNRDAIGARVELYVSPQDKTPRIKTLRAGEGYLSQSSKWLHFGLGMTEQVARVIVRWPAGETETFDNVEVDRRYILVQGSAQAQLWKGPTRQVRLKTMPYEGTKQPKRRVAFPGRWVKSGDANSSE